MSMSLLTLSGVSKSFNGLHALRDVSFAVSPGEVVGIIGPNGAGKTTLINLISGELRPTSGRILFRHEDVTGRVPYALAQMGIVRTFQVVRVFPGMSVRDNVTVGAICAGHCHGLAEARDKADEVLRFVGLAHIAHRFAGEVGLPDQKRTQVARALAMEPALLLLDEAMAGLNPREIGDALELIRQVNAQGVTLVVIEHLMKVVMGVSTRVIVLHHGNVIAEGTPSEVIEDRAVVDAYFGHRYGKVLIQQRRDLERPTDGV